jgi:aryl-alcohol dehydrogenase-like predicted oxidoreductase
MSAQAVPRRPLGRTGLEVSALGLGTVKLGRDRGVRYATEARVPTDEEAFALLRVCAELGVTLIDTAPAYGVSEERLGAMLWSIRPRDIWQICTKAGETFDPDAAGGPTSRYDFTPEGVRASVEGSLRRLRTDAVDILLLHFPGSNDMDERVLSEGRVQGVLEALRREGKARAVGASIGTAGGAALALRGDAGRGLPPLDVVMVNYNALDRESASWITEGADRGVGVLVKKPLASGRAPGSSLREVLGLGGVSAAIVGTTSPDHLRENARWASGSTPPGFAEERAR